MTDIDEIMSKYIRKPTTSTPSTRRTQPAPSSDYKSVTSISTGVGRTGTTTSGGGTAAANRLASLEALFHAAETKAEEAAKSAHYTLNRFDSSDSSEITPFKQGSTAKSSSDTIKSKSSTVASSNYSRNDKSTNAKSKSSTVASSHYSRNDKSTNDYDATVDLNAALGIASNVEKILRGEKVPEVSSLSTREGNNHSGSEARRGNNHRESTANNNDSSRNYNYGYQSNQPSVKSYDYDTDTIATSNDSRFNSVIINKNNSGGGYSLGDNSLGDNSSTRSTYGLLKELEEKATTTMTQPSISLPNTSLSIDDNDDESSGVSTLFRDVKSTLLDENNNSSPLESLDSSSVISNLIETLQNNDSFDSVTPLKTLLVTVAVNAAQAVLDRGGSEEIAEVAAGVILGAEYEDDGNEDDDGDGYEGLKIVVKDERGVRGLAVDVSYAVLEVGGEQELASAAAESVLDSIKKINGTSSGDDKTMPKKKKKNKTTVKTKTDVNVKSQEQQKTDDKSPEERDVKEKQSSSPQIVDNDGKRDQPSTLLVINDVSSSEDITMGESLATSPRADKSPRSEAGLSIKTEEQESNADSDGDDDIRGHPSPSSKQPATAAAASPPQPPADARSTQTPSTIRSMGSGTIERRQMKVPFLRKQVMTSKETTVTTKHHEGHGNVVYTKSRELQSKKRTETIVGGVAANELPYSSDNSSYDHSLPKVKTTTKPFIKRSVLSADDNDVFKDETAAAAATPTTTPPVPLVHEDSFERIRKRYGVLPDMRSIKSATDGTTTQPETIDEVDEIEKIKERYGTSSGSQGGDDVDDDDDDEEGVDNAANEIEKTFTNVSSVDISRETIEEETASFASSATESQQQQSQQSQQSQQQLQQKNDDTKENKSPRRRKGNRKAVPTSLLFDDDDDGQQQHEQQQQLSSRHNILQPVENMKQQEQHEGPKEAVNQTYSDASSTITKEKSDNSMTSSAASSLSAMKYHRLDTGLTSRGRSHSNVDDNTNDRGYDTMTDQSYTSGEFTSAAETETMDDMIDRLRMPRNERYTSNENINRYHLPGGIINVGDDDDDDSSIDYRTVNTNDDKTETSVEDDGISNNMLKQTFTSTTRNSRVTTPGASQSVLTSGSEIMSGVAAAAVPPIVTQRPGEESMCNTYKSGAWNDLSTGVFTPTDPTVATNTVKPTATDGMISSSEKAHTKNASADMMGDVNISSNNNKIDEKEIGSSFKESENDKFLTTTSDSSQSDVVINRPANSIHDKNGGKTGAGRGMCQSDVSSLLKDILVQIPCASQAYSTAMDGLGGVSSSQNDNTTGPNAVKARSSRGDDLPYDDSASLGIHQQIEIEATDLLPVVSELQNKKDVDNVPATVDEEAAAPQKKKMRFVFTERVGQYVPQQCNVGFEACSDGTSMILKSIKNRDSQAGKEGCYHIATSIGGVIVEIFQPTKSTDKGSAMMTTMEAPPAATKSKSYELKPHNSLNKSESGAGSSKAESSMDTIDLESNNDNARNENKKNSSPSATATATATTPDDGEVVAPPAPGSDENISYIKVGISGTESDTFSNSLPSQAITPEDASRSTNDDNGWLLQDITRTQTQTALEEVPEETIIAITTKSPVTSLADVTSNEDVETQQQQRHDIEDAHDDEATTSQFSIEVSYTDYSELVSQASRLIEEAIMEVQNEDDDDDDEQPQGKENNGNLNNKSSSDEYNVSNSSDTNSTMKRQTAVEDWDFTPKDASTKIGVKNKRRASSVLKSIQKLVIKRTWRKNNKKDGDSGAGGEVNAIDSDSSVPQMSSSDEKSEPVDAAAATTTKGSVPLQEADQNTVYSEDISRGSQDNSPATEPAEEMAPMTRRIDLKLVPVDNALLMTNSSHHRMATTPKMSNAGATTISQPADMDTRATATTGSKAAASETLNFDMGQMVDSYVAYNDTSSADHTSEPSYNVLSSDKSDTSTLPLLQTQTGDLHSAETPGESMASSAPGLVGDAQPMDFKQNLAEMTQTVGMYLSGFLGINEDEKKANVKIGDESATFNNSSYGGLFTDSFTADSSRKDDGTTSKTTPTAIEERVQAVDEGRAAADQDGDGIGRLKEFDGNQVVSGDITGFKAKNTFGTDKSTTIDNNSMHKALTSPTNDISTGLSKSEDKHKARSEELPSRVNRMRKLGKFLKKVKNKKSAKNKANKDEKEPGDDEEPLITPDTGDVTEQRDNNDIKSVHSASVGVDYSTDNEIETTYEDNDGRQKYDDDEYNMNSADSKSIITTSSLGMNTAGGGANAVQYTSLVDDEDDDQDQQREAHEQREETVDSKVKRRRWLKSIRKKLKNNARHGEYEDARDDYPEGVDRRDDDPSRSTRGDDNGYDDGERDDHSGDRSSGSNSYRRHHHRIVDNDLIDDDDTDMYNTSVSRTCDNDSITQGRSQYDDRRDDDFTNSVMTGTTNEKDGPVFSCGGMTTDFTENESKTNKSESYYSRTDTEGLSTVPFSITDKTSHSKMYSLPSKVTSDERNSYEELHNKKKHITRMSNADNYNDYEGDEWVNSKENKKDFNTPSFFSCGGGLNGITADDDYDDEAMSDEAVKKSDKPPPRMYGLCVGGGLGRSGSDITPPREIYVEFE